MLQEGKTQLELTLCQHFKFIGSRMHVVKACHACNVYESLKVKQKNMEYYNKLVLRAMTMIDPAIPLFEIVEGQRYQRVDWTLFKLQCFLWEAPSLVQPTVVVVIVDRYFVGL